MGDIELSIDISGVVIRKAGGRIFSDKAEFRGEPGVDSGVATKNDHIIALITLKNYFGKNNSVPAEDSSFSEY